MTNDSEKRIIDETVPSALAGQRVDRVISLVADIPRAAASQIIDAGAVLLDGVVVKAGKIKVTEGQRIVVDLSLLPEKQLPAAEPNIKVDVVYVDEDVIVINKQAGIMQCLLFIQRLHRSVIHFGLELCIALMPARPV